jgi:hypothetical protein
MRAKAEELDVTKLAIDRSLLPSFLSHKKRREATMPPAAGPPPTAAALLTMLDKMRSEDKVRSKKREEKKTEKERGEKMERETSARRRRPFLDLLASTSTGKKTRPEQKKQDFRYMATSDLQASLAAAPRSPLLPDDNDSPTGAGAVCAAVLARLADPSSDVSALAVKW